MSHASKSLLCVPIAEQYGAGNVGSKKYYYYLDSWQLYSIWTKTTFHQIKLFNYYFDVFQELVYYYILIYYFTFKMDLATLL